MHILQKLQQTIINYHNGRAIYLQGLLRAPYDQAISSIHQKAHESFEMVHDQGKYGF